MSGWPKTWRTKWRRSSRGRVSIHRCSGNGAIRAAALATTSGASSTWRSAIGISGPLRGGHLRRVLQPELVDGRVAQLELLDLAGDGHRELVDEAHVARHLVVGDLAATPLAQVVLGAGDALAQDDERGELLAVA